MTEQTPNNCTDNHANSALLSPPPPGPAEAIMAIMRALYEKGATANVLEKLVGMEQKKTNYWAQQYGWKQAPKRLFRNGGDDLLPFGIEDPNIAQIKGLVLDLYAQGLTINQMYHATGIKETQLCAWFDTQRTNGMATEKDAKQILEQRIKDIAKKDDLTDADLVRIDKLSRVLFRLNRVCATSSALVSGQHPLADALAPTPTLPKPEKKEKRRKANDISHITEDRIEEIRDELFFSYQKHWYKNRHHRNRFILKSRQIGATFYFAWEAFTDAILTRDNQIFLSSSRDQALVFRDYIVDLAQKYFDVEIKGQHLIKLSNGAKLRFLATNSATAQSFNGHLYRDEVFWMANYKKMKKVTSGMAAHKRWRLVDMSSPSAMSHEAYDVWCGAEYARNNGISDLDIDTRHEALKHGALGPDGVWRHMITVEDAQEQGCDLFDIEALKREHSKNDFDNLFMCKFIDDSQSVFSLQDLMDCIVDADDWPDYKPDIERPYANRPVAFGFDPSRTSDNASLAILKMPKNYHDYFKVLKLHSFHGQNVQRQASQIRELVDKHTVRHLGVDTTGIGSGVYDLILDYYPMATGIHYSPQMKTQLVVKMLDLVANKRFKYLSSQHEITRAFLMVTQTTTTSGQIVYASSRSPNAGHADIFWAIAHACLAEEINVNRRPTTVIFSE